MRCPKCGFISFDHLDFCRKCQKPLGSVAVMLHGSAYDCHAPMFLRFSRPEEGDEMERLDDPLISVIEEVEIEAPDLDAMRLNPLPAPSAKAKDAPTAPKVAADTTVRGRAEMATAVTKTLPPLSAPQSAATFFDEDELEPAVAPARSEEQPAALTLSQEEGIELPPALADISDLAPPGRGVEFTEVEGEDDLDLNLDLDLGFDLGDIQDMKEDAASQEAKPQPVAAAVPRKSPTGAVDMDSDLDFELDLGGLSLRDYDSGRK